MTAATIDMKTLQQNAEEIRNDELATIATASPGDVVRQGDLYLVCLDHLPEGGTQIANRQLAPGTTMGSRHIASGACRVMQCDSRVTAKAIKKVLPAFDEYVLELVGPLVVTDPTGEATIEHPEHGDRVLPCGTTWAVVYQRMHAEEVRRQMD